jgi:hypothetical protein
MNRITAGSLGLLLLACAVRGEEVEWRAGAGSSVPPAQLGAPVRPAFAEDMVKNSTVRPAFAQDVARKNALRLASFQTPAQPEPIGPPRKIEAQAKPVERDVWHLPAINEPVAAFDPLIVDPPVDPGRRFFFRGEYLGWAAKQMNSPPLVSTGTTPTVSPPTSFGFIGQPGTTVLYGNGPIGNSFHSGGRFTAGMWMDECQTCGLETSLFFLGQSIEQFHADSIGFPVLTRPFFRANPPTPQESGQLVSFPPGFTFGNGTAIPDLTGAIDVRTVTQLWGLEFTAKECLCLRGRPCGGFRIDLFAGFRYLDLMDQLTIQERLLIGGNDPLVPAGTTATVDDRFSTHNQFYGAQVGVQAEYRRKLMFAEFKGSIGLGGTAQTLVIDGSQLVTQPGQGTQVFQGGLLALPSNMGRFTHGEFSFVNELAVNLGMQITPGMRVFVGYDFLFWTRVMRASEQIDRVIDVNQVPNFVPPGTFPPIFPPRPVVLFTQNDFWVQGIQVGMQFRW